MKTGHNAEVCLKVDTLFADPLLSEMYVLLLGFPLSAPMAAYGKMSAGAKLAYGETYPIPSPGNMHAWYSNLPSNATCEVLIQVACA